jgi:hypothetical protein
MRHAATDQKDGKPYRRGHLLGQKPMLNIAKGDQMLVNRRHSGGVGNEITE